MNIKNLDRRLSTILLIIFVNSVGAAMIVPILPLFAQREFKLSPQLITLLNASFFVAQFVAGPYLGQLSDRYGRLPVLIISQIGTAISFVMIAFAHTVPLLFIARSLDGITGGNLIVAQAYVTDVTPSEKRTEALGYVFAAGGVGFILGPAIGGFLSAAWGARIPYVLAAGVATVTVVLTWFLLAESLSPEERTKKRGDKQRSFDFMPILQNHTLLLVLTITFVGQFVFGLVQATFALYGADVIFRGYSQQAINVGIGLLLTLAGIGQALAQTVLLRMALQRFVETQLVVAGLAVRGLGLLLYAFITALLPSATGVLLFALGGGLAMPPLQGLATQAVSERMRGSVLGLFQSVVGLAIILSTAVAGVIYAINPQWIPLVASLITLIGLLPAFILYRKE